MYQFDQAVSLFEQTQLQFTGNLSEKWCIAGNPNGGYLTSILFHAMLKVDYNPLGLIITAHFFSRCVPGEYIVEVEKLSGSKQFDWLQAKIIQEGRERIRATATIANENVNSGTKWYERPAPVIASPDDCILVSEPLHTLYSQLNVLLDPDCTGWMKGDLSDKSEIKGWAKFKDDRPFDLMSVLLFADAFPPAVMSHRGDLGWIPTLSYSVNVRRFPETDFLKCIFRTRFVSNGFLEEDSEIWDENDELVAISRQIAQIKRT